jgi:hypothetical protein
MEKQTLQIRVGRMEYCDSAEQDFLEALLQVAEECDHEYINMINSAIMIMFWVSRQTEYPASKRQGCMIWIR